MRGICRAAKLFNKAGTLLKEKMEAGQAHLRERAEREPSRRAALRPFLSRPGSGHSSSKGRAPTLQPQETVMRSPPSRTLQDMSREISPPSGETAGKRPLCSHAFLDRF